MRPAHLALREGTREDHERLDALFGGFDLTDADSYARFLAAHAEALLPIEAGLAGELVTADWAARKRGHLLLEDLSAVRAELVEGRPNASGTGFDKLTPNGGEPGIPEIAGLLYVIEGSRLGGKFLARQVAPGLPTRYLAADQPKGAWQALLDAIDAALPHEASRLRAVDAAKRAFAAFETAGTNWLS